MIHLSDTSFQQTKHRKVSKDHLHNMAMPLGCSFILPSLASILWWTNVLSFSTDILFCPSWLITLKPFPTHSSLLPHTALARKSNTLSLPFLQWGMTEWPSSGKWGIYSCLLGERENLRKTSASLMKRKNMTSMTTSLSPDLAYELELQRLSCYHDLKAKRTIKTCGLWYYWVTEPKVAVAYLWKCLVLWEQQLLLFKLL